MKVEVEFSKKITVKKFEGDPGELKNFLFASVFESNSNLSVFMLEQGLINLQPPRTEDDMTKHLEELKIAETKGKKERKGLHKSEYIKVPTFNDISGGKGKKVDAAKAKSLFEFLQD